MTQLLDTSAVPDVVLEAGRLFQAAGHDLSLVGGPVRDLFLGRVSTDLDFTTDATPDQTLAVIKGWADAVWEIGREFGTIGLRRGDMQLEITTYRAEAYDPASRKPVVAFGTELADDLVRRDFTVNSMALRLPSLELVDPHGGVRDLHARLLRTPGTPQSSFDDDPLRMMRAARFASQLRMDVAPEVLAAMTDMAARLEIVSAERVRDELVKLINGADPRRGVEIMVDTGLADVVLPEVPALRLETDSAHHHKDVYQHSLTVMEQAVDLERPGGPVIGPDFPLRFAALMHDVGKPDTRRFSDDGAVSFRHHDVVGAKLTRKRMKALRFDNETIKTVTRLVELHMRFYGYGEAGWTDSAVRRYVRDAGDQLDRLHLLTRSDVTTKNKRKAGRLARSYDDLERRILELAEQEELAAVRPELDGQQIMEILGIGPSKTVGEAYNFLLELRLDEGEIGRESAEARLREWWAANRPDDDSAKNAAPNESETGL
ncbi:CCA tRNA nucleotidyltransferase [Kocuria sp. JC486]|uniref:CCA tRNA nucleotidyltransferase n=1 Tax=Kocuria sp. JC486 TaxID=1970736 RepID=UPI0014218331|nr:CCA tRNA nucleotidyltransferase [Kocuria sp. JC486]NHU84895.1 CCA tRNA nucleotidyltransferase [Kocuria sp. JC486]